jgi:sulfite exporter TauE/SafE
MLAMGVYGLGTVPVLLVLGFGSDRLAPRIRHGFHRIASFLVIVIAFQILLRGLAAFHLVPHLRWGGVVFW